MSDCEKALANIFMWAKRQRRRAVGDDQIIAWDTVLRFCGEAGMRSSILRDPMRDLPPDERPTPKE